MGGSKRDRRSRGVVIKDGRRRIKRERTPLEAPVSSEIDLAVSISGFLLKGRDALEGSIKGRKVDEGDPLLLDDPDMLNLSKALKVLQEELLGHVLLNPAHKDVAGGAVLHRLQNVRWERLGLSPPHLHLPVLKHEPAKGGFLEEELRRRGVNKGDEGAPLFRDDFDRVDHPAVDMVENLLCGGPGVNASKVDRAVPDFFLREGGKAIGEERMGSRRGMGIG